MAREDERIVAVTPAMPVGSKLEAFQKSFRIACLMLGLQSSMQQQWPLVLQLKI